MTLNKSLPIRFQSRRFGGIAWKTQRGGFSLQASQTRSMCFSNITSCSRGRSCNSASQQKPEDSVGNRTDTKHERDFGKKRCILHPIARMTV